MQRRLPWVIILIVLLVGFVYWLSTRPKSASQPIAEATTVADVATAVPATAPAQTEPEVSLAESGLQQIYYNSEGDFSLLLPLDWVVGEAEATPLGNQYALGPNSPEGSTLLITEATTTLEEVLAQVTCDGCEVNSQKEVTLQSSQIAVQRVNLKGASLPREVEWFFVENGDKLVALSINNPRTLESLDAIIHSFAPGQIMDIGIESLTAVQAGREHLAGQFGLDPYNVIVESLEATEWPDTCIGADLPNQLCESTPTKGYIMDLRLGGQVIPYHTNESGTKAVPKFPIGY